MSDGPHRARHLVLTMLHALRAGDGALLESLFAPEVIRVDAKQRAARQTVVAQCLETARQVQLAAPARLEDAVDLAHLRVTPLGSGAADLSPELRPEELAVDVPVRRQNRAAPRVYEGLPCLSRLFVRAGREPQIVGVQR